MTICNILLQFNVLRLSNNVLIHWFWLLLLLHASYCQRVELFFFLTVHSSNQCYNNEWQNTGNNCCNGNIGRAWGARCITATNQKEAVYISLYTSFIKHISSLYLHVGSVVAVSVGVVVLHSTWEGSGLHLPSLPHVALRYDRTSPGCWHWKNISEFITVLVYASTITPLLRVGGAPQSTILAGKKRKYSCKHP